MDALAGAALDHVTVVGWSREAIARGALDRGLSSAASGLLPRGPLDLVDHFVQRCDREMIEAMRADPVVHELAPRGVLRHAIRQRLALIVPFVSCWPQAMALGAQDPWRTARQVARLADEIGHLAGDRSVRSPDWYMKRAGIAAVYVSTELFLLTDRSVGQVDTWRFLDRRLDDLSAAIVAPQQIGRYVGGAGAVLAQSVLSLVGQVAGCRLSRAPDNDRGRSVAPSTDRRDQHDK